MANIRTVRIYIEEGCWSGPEILISFPFQSLWNHIAVALDSKWIRSNLYWLLLQLELRPLGLLWNHQPVDEIDQSFPINAGPIYIINRIHLRLEMGG